MHVEPGTIVGPDYNGEYLCAIGPEMIDLGTGLSIQPEAMYWAPLDTDEPGGEPVEPHTWQRVTPERTEFRYATVNDLAAADARPEPWSVAEAKRKPRRGAE